MADTNPTENERKDGESPESGIAGPVIIPAAAAFVGALVGAIIGNQLG